MSNGWSNKRIAMVGPAKSCFRSLTLRLMPEPACPQNCANPLPESKGALKRLHERVEASHQSLPIQSSVQSRVSWMYGRHTSLTAAGSKWTISMLSKPS